MSVSAPGSGDPDSRTRVIYYTRVETELDPGQLLFHPNIRSFPYPEEKGYFHFIGAGSESGVMTPSSHWG